MCRSLVSLRVVLRFQCVHLGLNVDFLARAAFHGGAQLVAASLYKSCGFEVKNAFVFGSGSRALLDPGVDLLFVILLKNFHVEFDAVPMHPVHVYVFLLEAELFLLPLVFFCLTLFEPGLPLADLIVHPRVNGHSFLLEHHCFRHLADFGSKSEVWLRWRELLSLLECWGLSFEYLLRLLLPVLNLSSLEIVPMLFREVVLLGSADLLGKWIYGLDLWIRTGEKFAQETIVFLVLANQLFANR